MDKKVKKYVLSHYNEFGFKNPNNKLLQMKTSIPKSLSTSCIRTAWKSNQTEITKEIVNTYFFHKRCGGHRRLFYTEGVVYKQDLTISMYCSCKAKPFPKEKLVKYAKPIQVQFGNEDNENNDNNIHTFFNRKSMSGFGVNSIPQIHPTFIVPDKIDMILPPKLPKFRLGKFERTETRSMTREKLKIHQEKQDSSININSIPQGKDTIKSQRRPPYQLNKEEGRTPRPGFKAAATSAAKQGAATATKLLTLKKKASPPPDQ